MLAFYGEGPNGFSGVMMLVNRELRPKVVFNHRSGRVLGIEIEWDEKSITIITINGNNEAKGRTELWKDVNCLEFKGEWVLVGDFNMVEKKLDKFRSATSSLVGRGGGGGEWDELREKLLLVDFWELGSWGDLSGPTYFRLWFCGHFVQA